MNSIQEALMVIEAVKNEIRMGTRHYTASGKLLTKPKDIIQAMKNSDLVVEPVQGRRYLFEGMVRP